MYKILMLVLSCKVKGNHYYSFPHCDFFFPLALADGLLLKSEQQQFPQVYWNRLSIRFGLVSLFNGITTFVGYLMPKSSF